MELLLINLPYGYSSVTGKTVIIHLLRNMLKLSISAINYIKNRALLKGRRLANRLFARNGIAFELIEEGYAEWLGPLIGEKPVTLLVSE